MARRRLSLPCAKEKSCELADEKSTKVVDTVDSPTRRTDNKNRACPVTLTRQVDSDDSVSHSGEELERADIDPRLRGEGRAVKQQHRRQGGVPLHLLVKHARALENSNRRFENTHTHTHTHTHTYGSERRTRRNKMDRAHRTRKQTFEHAAQSANHHQVISTQSQQWSPLITTDYPRERKERSQDDSEVIRDDDSPAVATPLPVCCSDQSDHHCW